MSRRHVTAALIIGIAAVSAAAVLAVSRFPMTLSPNAPSASVTRQGDVPRPGNGISEPRIVHEVKPIYTPAALQAKVQGDVYLDVVVDANGDPGAITVAQSLDREHGLDESARQAAAQWKFEPARRDGVAVPVLVTVQMTFTLR